MDTKDKATKTETGEEKPVREATMIVGLGNPGAEYRDTYHNAGIRALSLLAPHAAFEAASTKTFLFAKENGRIFIQPLTFMNESGIAVRDALRYFGKTPNDLLVIHDDADIPLGELRLQFGRGAAGHHGIESITHHLGTTAFWRARIGIEQRTPLLKRRVKAMKYVLRPVTRAHAPLLQAAIDLLAGELAH